MSCRNVETIITELARGQMLEARLKEDALAHIEACKRCAGRFADEQTLTAGLRAAAIDAATQETPMRVEAALLSAFRQGAVSPHVSAKAPMPQLATPWLPWSIAAAAAILAAKSGGTPSGGFAAGESVPDPTQGLEVVEGFDRSDATVHDPHCVRLCPGNPDRLYQQNHCGIYRIDRPSNEWVRIGKAMPKQVGDIGFPMVLHPRDADTAWVFPMDGQTVWPRTSPDGKPAVFATHNGGKSWTRLDTGLPEKQAWWTVKRQAMSADASDPVGLYFGTTSGELWMSRDEGKGWTCIARHLPEIYSVEAAVLP